MNERKLCFHRRVLSRTECNRFEPSSLRKLGEDTALRGRQMTGYAAVDSQKKTAHKGSCYFELVNAENYVLFSTSMCGRVGDTDVYLGILYTHRPQKHQNGAWFIAQMPLMGGHQVERQGNYLPGVHLRFFTLRQCSYNVHIRMGRRTI